MYGSSNLLKKIHFQENLLKSPQIKKNRKFHLGNLTVTNNLRVKAVKHNCVLGYPVATEDYHMQFITHRWVENDVVAIKATVIWSKIIE